MKPTFDYITGFLQPGHGETERYLVFIAGGGTGMLINLCITYVLTEFVCFWYMLSYAIGQTVNLLFNFFYHRYVTFRVRSQAKGRFGRFILVSAGVISASWLLVWFITECLQCYYILSIILVVFSVSIIDFLINKMWVFKE